MAKTLERISQVIIRFAGDSGDGMQLVGDRFTELSAAFGNDLATGEPGAVMRVARAFSVYVEKNGALLDHTLATALVDRDGRIVEIWRGNGWKLDEVTAALRAAAADRTD